MIHRKGGNPSFTQYFDVRFQQDFKILRIQILSPDQDQILEATGNEQFPVMYKCQISGTQPGFPVLADKSLSGCGLVLPIALRDAWARHPDFANCMILHKFPCLRMHQRQRMTVLHCAAVYDGLSGGIRFEMPRCHSFRIDIDRTGPAAGPPAGYQQGRFGQSVAGIDRVRIQTRCLEFLCKGCKGFLANRFRTTECNPPAAQVQCLHRAFANALHAQPECKIGPSTDTAAVSGNGFQPAYRTLQKMHRRQERQSNTTVQWLHEPPHQSHIMEQWQPADETVRFSDFKTLPDCQLVSNQIVISDHHPFRSRCRAGGVLQKRDAVLT